MLSNKLTLDEIKEQIPGKRVLVRADFNVPLDKGVVKDDKRIRETIHTIFKILEYGPKCIVIMSHLGRPNGKPNPKYSMKPVAERLQQILGLNVTFLPACVGDEVKNAIDNCKPEEIFLLENVRFHLEEEGKATLDNGETVKASKEDVTAFRKQLTSLGDIYVNDAFGTAHRAHSSLVGIDLPIRVSGILMQTELEYFSKALETPQRPVLGRVAD